MTKKRSIMKSHSSPSLQLVVWLAVAVTLVSLALVAWTSFGQNRSVFLPANVSPSGQSKSSNMVDIATPVATSSPTYSVPGLIATTEALMLTIPSATPEPGYAPEIQADQQHNDLRRRAAGTAVTLYPPPGDLYDSTSTPGPTPPTRFPRPVPTHPASAGGMIYEEMFFGPPCNRIYAANLWQIEVNNVQTTVCAGFAKGGTAPPGALVIGVRHVHSDPEQYTPVPDGYYVTPPAMGGLRIEDVVADRVLLSTDRGYTLAFDLSTRQWIYSTPQPSPSITSPPIPSPSASPLPTQLP
jgi:hypothetical protein